MKIVSLNIGKSREVVWKNKKLRTGIFKTPVQGSIFLDKESVKEDSIVDRKHHGGIDQAVYGFGLQHYAFFKVAYPNLDWQYGMFGENITFDELEETEIRTGETYQLGNAKIQVTIPRQPCYKLGIRFQNQGVVKTMWNSTKSGIYFKVIEPGKVAIGDQLHLLNPSEKEPTIAEIYTQKRLKKNP